MDIQGEYRLTASRQRVWDMLNDPAVLRDCIPGCQSLEADGDDGYKAKVTAAVGPVKSTFDTRVTLENLAPPESYTLAGEAKSPAAGFGRGEARVELAEDGSVTVLTYAASLKVGGKLAQIGSRMVAGATRKTADEFFDRFAALVDPGAEKVEPPPAATTGPGLNLWIAGAVVAALVVVLWWLL
ncbi:MAG: carbon monoxide dehydrogenase subunit G [Pseudomonadota bacterium]